MESFISHLEPIFRQFINLILAIIVMAFFIRPLLNYFALNREIEHRKMLIKELQESRGIVDEDLSDNEEGNSLSDQEKLQGMAANAPDQAEKIVKKMIHEE